MRTNVATAIQTVSGLFLLLFAVDLGYMLWNLCSGTAVFPEFQRSPVSCLSDDGLTFNPTRWLLYETCVSALLGAAALFLAWSVLRHKRWLRSAWTAISLLTIIYFILFWALSAKNMMSLAGWSLAGIYCLILFLPRVLFNQPRRSDDSI